MGGACGTYGRQERWWGDLMRRDHLVELVVDRRIMLKWIPNT
jgi:hypothetical protein